MLPLGVDRRINQNPEYNRKIRIQPEYQNTNGISEYNRKIRTQSEIQNTIEKLEYLSENRTTYKKIKTGETQKHKNTKTQKKRGMQQIHISAAKIIYGEDDRTKKHHQRI